MVGDVGLKAILVAFICASCVNAEQWNSTVLEEQGVGTVVGTISRINGDYSLRDNEYFRLEGRTLVTDVIIDREALENDVIKLTAVSINAGEAPIEISVKVLDINDNNPYFTTSPLTLNITESSNTNTKYILQSAEDMDSGQNAEIQEYRIIEGDSNTFELELETTAERSILYLKIKMPLNRETTDRYFLNISAEDGGIESRQGYFQLIVYVQDTNDNQPEFVQSEYRDSFSEDTSVGSVLFTVHADDIDEDENGLVTYAIASQSQPGVFGINETSGQILLTSELDYETLSSHEITITATDGGIPAMADSAYVSVDVTNVNDNDPDIVFTYFPSTASVASVTEQVAVGDRVAFVSVTDPDGIANPEDVSMEIVSGNELGHFELIHLTTLDNGKFGKIQVAANTGLADNPSYNLTVRADDGDPVSARVALASMVILVNSANEHPPQFDRPSYSANISELVPIGSIVTSVHATDVDAGISGRLVYRIEEGNGHGWVTINRATGLITTNRKIHFDEISKNGTINLRISAKDETAVPLVDETEVTIIVYDENDNPPEFDQEFYSFIISENVIGTIGQVGATDRDFGTNGEIAFRLDDVTTSGYVENDLMNYFSVSEDDGEIRNVISLDRELAATYRLRVSAFNLRNPLMTSYIYVEVEVSDVNDNIPSFYPVLYFINLPTTTLAGTVVATLTATDPDESDADRTTYSFGDISSTAAMYYNLNPRTGEVELTRTVSGRDGFDDVISIFARDGDGKVSSINATLSIAIRSTEPNLEFKRQTYYFELLEDSNVDYRVGQIELLTSNPTKFYISNGDRNGAFRIESNTGILHVANSSLLDSETESNYNLTITAEINQDGSSRTLGFVSCTCLLTVIDVNNHRPTFTDLSQTARPRDSHAYYDNVAIELSSISEYNYLYNAHAIDLDVGDNGKVIYTASSSYSDKYIDTSSGEIYIQPLASSMTSSGCLETELLFTIVAYACDLGAPRLCTTLYLYVKVTLLDGKFSLPMPNIFLNLPENLPLNSRVTTLQGFDQVTEGSNTTIIYDIYPNDQAFDAFPNGDILLVKDLDFESSSNKELSVQASIVIAGNEWDRTSVLTVNVLDVNDNPPRTSRKIFQFAVKEDSNPGEFVGNIVASDADSAVYSSLQYEIDSILPSIFYCDRNTGNIYNTAKLSRELLLKLGISFDQIILNVTIADQGGENSTISPYNYVEVKAEIFTEYTDRYPLKFGREFYFVKVMENATMTNLLQVKATDDDVMLEDDDVTYEIYEAEDRNVEIPFEIDELSGMIRIKSDGVLDREISEVYRLTLEARSSQSAEIGVSKLFIQILDVEDSPPVFNEPFFRFYISESSPTMSIVGKVVAHDGDVTTTTTSLTYELVTETSVFEIDSKSGYTFLLSDVDYENQQEYNLTVRVTDEDGESSSTYIIISILDANDNIPVFQESYSPSIREGLYESPYEVARLRATDVDSDGFGSVRYSLVTKSPTGFGRSSIPVISVNELTGSVTVTGLVDREKSPTIDITVRAHDMAESVTDRKWKDLNLFIRVEDINDNRPVFKNPDTVLLESRFSSINGHRILKLSASDLDEGANGQVTFSLSDDGINSNLFAIDDEGYLILASPLSSTGITYRVDVFATDTGTSPQTTQTTLNIIVADEPLVGGPVFFAGVSQFTLAETGGSGSYVTRLSASSTQDSGTVRYYVINSSSRSSGESIYPSFVIDHGTGEITQNTDLDGDDVTEYLVEIIAVDDSSTKDQPRITKTTITVTITDENDNAPLFASDTQRLSVSESAQPGSFVTTVSARDNDVNDNVIYSLVTKDGSALTDFIINPSNAQISVGSSGLDRERQSLYELQVVADDGVHRSFSEVVFLVDDVVDSPPTFNSTILCYDVTENSPPGTVVGRLIAADDDVNKRITYSLINDTYAGMFAIHQLFGVIMFEGEDATLDRETQDLYILNVRATDEGGLYADIRVFIYVGDVNDNEPIFDVMPNDVIELQENLDVGTLVTTLHASDIDIDLNAEIEYQIIGGDSNKRFEIDSYSGELRTASLLNREEQRQYNLTIMARNSYASEDYDKFVVTMVSVNLIDVNDNAPQFLTPPIVYLKENVANRHSVVPVTAVDLDLNENGHVQFALVQQSPSHSIFQLDSGNIVVRDNTNLDYETTQMYNLTVVAYDRGDPELSSMTNIAVHIVDINDNSPLFQETSYSATMNENSAVGSYVTTVQASDEDSGFNGDIRYSIKQSINSTHFYISTYTGEIFLANRLDYESHHELSIEVQATDGGADSRSSFVTVTLSITDDNDCSPAITPEYTLTAVRENTRTNVPLLKFTAIDNDSGNNGIVDFSSGITSSPETDAFRLQSDFDGAYLYLDHTLDREMAHEYILTVRADDRGTPRRTSSAYVQVLVEDRNDNVPEFEQNQYYARVQEDVEPGTVVTRVRAVDDDSSACRYKLDDVSSTSPFYVNPTTGDLHTREHLDREIVSSYNLTVMATDEGDSEGIQNTVSVQIYVTITDANDDPPSFPTDDVVVYVNSAASANVIVMVAEAIDSDAGENGRITYRIIGNNKFSIDPNTGVIQTTQFLTSQNSFQVQATDHGPIPKTATLNVDVYLINKERPSIRSSAGTSFAINEGSAPATLTTFAATSSRTDAGQIRFSLKGDRFGWFTLHPTSGQLATKDTVDRELLTSQPFTIWIEATDSGSPQLSSFKRIDVEIDDVNDNAPTFSDDVYIAHVREDETKLLSTVFASDPDEGESNRVSYSIVEELSEESDLFVISSDQGTLRNLQRLDREVKSSYKLVVRATDNGPTPLFRDITVHVIVDDVNDNPPIFTRLFSATISEDAKIGEFVLQVTSTDADEMSEHRYELTDDSNGTFVIDDVTGHVTVAKKLDRETVDRHTLIVQSSDDEWRKHTAVIVLVEDTNDNPPRFKTSTYAGSVSVDAGIGEVVLRANATDLDDGLNGMISYRISGGNRYFSVDQSGQITTREELHCSSNEPGEGCPVTHRFSVIACDSGIPNMLCDSCTVLVTIKPVNEHPPAFDNSLVTVAVLETTSVGTEVYSLSATDLEPGTLIQYRILEVKDYSYFTIETGNSVVLRQGLTGISVGEYLRMSVEASDDGLPAKSAILNLNFEITGTNLHSPVFTRPSYQSSPVSESSLPGTEVVVIEATDADIGINGNVAYSIISGNNGSKFDIDKLSGMIILSSPLDYEEVNSYNLVVTASDMGMHSRTVGLPATVRIAVRDEDDHVPQFNSSQFKVRVQESTRTKEIIARLTATDGDVGQNALVQYSLNNMETFAIRPLTGDVYLSIQLDYETQTDHVVTIFAANGGSSERSNATLTVHVIGVNEYPPVFTESSYEFNLPSSSLSGTEIGVINATDEDSGPDGIINYMIVPNQDSGNFELDKMSGIVVVIRSSPYVVGDVIYLDVIAKNPTSSSQRCLFDEARMKINVISNQCHLAPCKNGATCRDGLRSVTCDCLTGYTGKFCDADIDDCAGNPCLQGECTDLVNGYSCTCDAGYTGSNCDVIIDYCEDHPCMNNGTCINGITSFSCDCTFGATGSTCDVNSIHFPPQSFIRVNGFGDQITFEFSTVYDTSLLLYSFFDQTSFILLEIIEGKLQLSVNTSENSELVKLQLETLVNDGSWHSLRVTIDTSPPRMILDDCTSTTENLCSGMLQMNQEDLDYSSQVITVGGIHDVNDLQTGRLSSHDFVGCLRSLVLDSRKVESSQSSEIRNSFAIGDGCPRTTSQPLCNDNTCQNGGSCTDLWEDAWCDCVGNWEGRACGDGKVGTTLSNSGYFTLTFSESYVRNAMLRNNDVTTTKRRRRRRNIGKTSSSLEITFRTRESEALLAFITDDNEEYYAALFVKENILQYHHVAIDRLVEVEVIGNITDGQWHTAKVEINTINDVSSDVIITLDATTSQQDSFNRGVNVIEDFTNPLVVKKIYIGGKPTSNSASFDTISSLQGCVLDFKLDGVTYQLNTDVTNYDIHVSAESAGISAGCDGSDVCGSNPCPSGEFCKDIWEAYACSLLGACTPPSPCLNKGDCEPTDSGSYLCHCQTNFTGPSCESFLPCNSVSCSNGKVCVPDPLHVTKCECQDGLIESDGVCANVSAAAGLDWWIIVLIVFLSVAFISAALILAICFRRKKKGKERKKENGAYEFQARKNHATPDLLPDDACIDASDAERQSNNNNGSLANVSSNGTLATTPSKPEENGTLPKINGSIPVLNGNKIPTGRFTANEFTRTEPLQFAPRASSAIPDLAPSPSPILTSRRTGMTSPVDRKRRQNRFHIRQAQTLPRKVPEIDENEFMSSFFDYVPPSTGRSSKNSSAIYTLPRDSYENGKHKRRHTDTLQDMVQELSGIVGLTSEEVDLLSAGVLAMEEDGDNLLYDDGGSVSTSSLTDMSMQSRTTSSSVRVKTFLRSPSPHKEPLMRDYIPNTVVNASLQTLPRASPAHKKHRDSFETLAVLGPFQFPPPPSSSSDSESSDSDAEASASVTSESTAVSTVKHTYSSTASSSGSSTNKSKLDLNFPSSLEKYFTSLVDVFEDLGDLKSDEKFRSPSRGSAFPGFVGHEVSLWSEIEELSKRPLKKASKRNSIISELSQSPFEDGGRRSKQLNSPTNTEVLVGSKKKERPSSNEDDKNEKKVEKSRRKSGERTERDKNMSPRREIEGRTTPRERRPLSSSSSNRSSRSGRKRTEFVKYV